MAEKHPMPTGNTRNAGNTCTLSVYVTPKASSNAVEGKALTDAGVEVRVRVTVPPDEGKANKAVCRTVAEFLGVPKTAVTVLAGATSRHKRLSIVGMDDTALSAALEVLE